MKYFPLLLALSSYCCSAQIGIGTSTPDTNSILDIKSSSKAIVIPRLTSAAMNSIAPEEGMLIFNVDLHHFMGGVSISDASPVTIAATLPPDSIEFSNSATKVGQSFTATSNMIIGRVRFGLRVSRPPILYVYSGSTGPAMYYLYEGSGMSGTLLATTPASYLPGSQHPFYNGDFSSQKIKLTNGQVYTVYLGSSLVSPSAPIVLMIDQNNVYAGGELFFDNIPVPGTDITVFIDGRQPAVWRQLDN